MRRREFLVGLAGATLVSPSRAQAPPDIGFLHAGSPEENEKRLAAFRKGLAAGGFVEGQNVSIAYSWARGRNDELPDMAADLVRRSVAMIVTPGSTAAAVAAKRATATIPIVFSSGTDPVGLGLVESLNRLDMDLDMSIGGIVVQGGVQRPIGVSAALATVPDQNGVMEDWYHGYKWPPADFLPYWTNASPTTFPHNYWDPKLYAITILGEFVTHTSGSGTAWNQLDAKLAALLPTTPAQIAAELDELVDLIEYRPGVLVEAMAQLTNPWRWFRGILMCNSKSAPATNLLVETASHIGQFQVMHYKRHFHRPRPSQFSPALLPPIDVPGHASFPSGHATESLLIALCLEQVMPPAASTPAGVWAPDNPPPPKPGISPLQQMAARIARNREVIGLHYPSDSRAGRLLAEESFEILMNCPTISHPHHGLIARAKKEWWP